MFHYTDCNVIYVSNIEFEVQQQKPQKIIKKKLIVAIGDQQSHTQKENDGKIPQKLLNKTRE